MIPWQEFLDARMKLIQAALKEGRPVHEVIDLISVEPLQAQLLVMNAIKLNGKEQ